MKVIAFILTGKRAMDEYMNDMQINCRISNSKSDIQF